MSPLLVAVALADPPTAWTFEAAIGGEVTQTPAGILNVSAERGPWRLAWITDTVDLRYEHEGDQGRWWAAARGEFGAVGLANNRWLAGAPAPQASQLGFYAGPEGGAVQYLGRGWYAGGQAHVRRYAWAPLPETVDTDPGQWVARPELLGGWWSPTVDVWARAGVDVGQVTRTVGLHGTLRIRPEGTIRPWVELRAGLAEGADTVSAVRLGGLNPYVVPLAGAAWAEFWVEDYAALRSAVRVRAGETWLAVVADAAAFDDRWASGVGLVGHAGIRAWTVDAGVGVAPLLERRRGIASSVFVLVGWRPGRPPPT